MTARGRSLRAAVAQIGCRPGDVPANLGLHRDAIAAARQAGADLLVFPELSLTDYLAAPDRERLGMSRSDPRLAGLAREAGPMAVSLGFIEREPGGGSFNSQALLAHGEVVAVHRKINLPSYGSLSEAAHYTPGRRLNPVVLAGWRLATLVCADAWNPALPWLAAIGGAELFVVPAASSLGAVDGPFDNPTGWSVNLAHHAVTYGLPVIFANHCGRRDDFDFWGGSRILDPWGRELARAGEQEGLILADLDPAQGRAARRDLPTVRDADPALVRELIAAHLESGAPCP